ncbi:MAG: potassium/proton antiporter [Alphaproteobacteria bacterium]|nr:potassium/proton antiporter [Alphaproteobacteria bacterium]
MDFINGPILVVSLLFVLSILTSLVSNRANIPLILVFLCIGLIVGDVSAGRVLNELHHPKVAFFIGSMALALILFDSGYQTTFKSLKKTATPSLVLSSVGVFLTSLFLAPATHYILEIGWLDSFLLASIIGSTDSASVFFLLSKGGVCVREKIKSTLEVESGSNDPMAIFLTFSFISIIIGKHDIFSFYLVGNFFLQMGIGACMGIALGYLIKWVLDKASLDTALYPILVLCMAMTGFSVTNMFLGSGFLALYIAGFLVGNLKVQGSHQILRFQSTLSWFSQIVMFLTLGFFADIQKFPNLIAPSLLTGLFLILIARPLAVFICLAPFKYRLNEKIFISFVGLRGATSILLALAPLVFDLPSAEKIFSVTFLMVLVSLGIQGFLMVPFARLCRVDLPIRERPPIKTEIDLPGMKDSFLVVYKLTEDSPVVCGEKMPKWVRPIAVHRGNMAYNGKNIKNFKSGDRVYFYVPNEAQMGELDKLFGGGILSETEAPLGDFVVSPMATLNDLKFFYGINVSEESSSKTLKELLEDNFSDLETGDRFSLGLIELVIRKVENGEVVEIGIALESDKNRKAKKIQFVQKKKI